MNRELSEEQQRALDGSRDVPARVIDPATRQVLVLLKSADFDWVRDKLPDESDVQRIKDPRTQESYALLPEGRYERFKALFEEDPLSSAEQRSLLREFGKRAGWDDPEMDIYDELYGRQE